jgi:hypothetical protein
MSMPGMAAPAGAAIVVLLIRPTPPLCAAGSPQRARPQCADLASYTVGTDDLPPNASIAEDFAFDDTMRCPNSPLLQNRALQELILLRFFRAI